MSATSIPTLDRPATSERSHLQAWSQWFMQPGVLIRVVLYVSTLIYLRSVLFDYVYDDSLLITLNPWMESWRQVPQLLTHSFWAFLETPRAIDFYRPLVSLVFATIRHLLGPAPGWFHLVAAGLHIGGTYLVYRLTCETIGNQRIAALAAGFFGLHPTKVETTAWISGISDSLSVVFFLAAIIWYFKARRDRDHKLKYQFVSAVLLLFALFSKEAAAFAPVLIAIYEFSSTDGRFRARCMVSLRAAWPFVAVTIFAIFARSALVQNQTEQSLRHLPLQSTLLTAPKAILWYVGKQLWPVELSVHYPDMVVRAFSFGQFVLPLALVVALALGLMLAVRGKPTGIFFASWFVLMLAPVIVCVAFLQVHDRYSYLPSVAFSIGIAYAMERLGVLGVQIQSAIVLMLFALMTGLTLNYESYWDNDIKLSTRVVQIAPNNPSALEYLVGSYIILGQPEKAEAFARSVISTTHGPEGWYILGTVLLSESKHEEAREAFRMAVKLGQGHRLEANLALATADFNLGRNEEAAQIYRELLERSPNRAFLHGRLATALKAMGKSEEAAREVALQKQLQ